MKLRAAISFLLFLVLPLAVLAEDKAAETAEHDTTTAAAAAVTTTAVGPATKAEPKQVNDLLERFVNWLHHFFPTFDEGLFHWIACGILFIAAILLRRFITNIIFHYLKKMAEKTETTLDDKLFPAMEGPVATLVMVVGIFLALTVLQLSEQMDRWVANGAQLSILAVIAWGVIRAGGAILDHAEEMAHERRMTVATFMPLIKKSLFVFAVIVSILLIADSLGFKIGVFLTSLGIGGLAFALAAQDTIANLFGSFVVVVDQPFKVGETVKIGPNQGVVEDIGLRSTKIRLVDKSLVVIPNKMVSSEAIVNLSRFTQRRVEQVLGLTYDTTPEQMTAIVEDIRGLILAESAVAPASVLVFFRDYSASSLDIFVVYVLNDPDAKNLLAAKQRINLAIMRAVAARGLSFAFPTSVMHLDGPVAKQIAERKKG